MIHYHGMPMSGPMTVAAEALKAGHAFVNFNALSGFDVVVEQCQSFAVDNGAFGRWKQGMPSTPTQEFYEFAALCKRIPSCDFAVIPDVINGSEDENDALIEQWPLGDYFGAPVFHMHESIARLERLIDKYPRVCLGSSGEFASVGSSKWWDRMSDVMAAATDADGRPLCKLHGLRMLNPAVFGRLPLASADSTNIARNVGIDVAWRGTYQPMTKEARAFILRSRIEATNSPATWTPQRV